MDLQALIREIVAEADRLKCKVAPADSPVNYVCIFCQNEAEFAGFSVAAGGLGRVAQDTPSGQVFLIPPVDTVAGPVHLLKIRKPDPTRPERGDADFTLSDFPTFKAANAGQPGFRLIQRPDLEMLEYAESGGAVRVYFSSPTLAEVLGLSELG